MDWYVVYFFFQAEDGIRDLVRSRGLGDVYKRQDPCPGERGKRFADPHRGADRPRRPGRLSGGRYGRLPEATLGRRQADGDHRKVCLLYTSDAADERSSVDLGGRRIITKKKERKKKTYMLSNESKRYTYHDRDIRWTTVQR